MNRRTLALLAVVSLLVGLMPLVASSATSGNVVEVTVDGPEVADWIQPGSPHHASGRGNCDGWEVRNNYNEYTGEGVPPASADEVRQLTIRIQNANGSGTLIAQLASGATHTVNDVTAATVRTFWWRQNAGFGLPNGGNTELPLTRDLSECHDLEGGHDSYEALFSNQTEATGSLVAAAPVNACSTLTNAGAVIGNIALVQTGACSAAAAYSNALAAGAAGVIFYNPSGSAVFLSGSPDSTTIPAVMVGQTTGADFAAALTAGYTVNLTIGDETTDTVNGPTWSGSLSSTDATQTSLTVNWPAATAGEGAVVSYRVYQGAVLLDTVGPATLSLGVTGLSAGTQYTFSVVADDALGLESAPLVGQLETNPLLAPTWPAEAALVPSNIQQTTLTLTWPAALDADGVVVEYEVYRGVTLLDTVAHPTTTFNVSGLTAGESYDFSVVAVDNHDLESAPLETTQSTAPLTAPFWGVGAELVASNVGQTTLTLTWPEADDDDGDVVNYQVYEGANLLATVGAATLTYNVTNLTPGTSYGFSVVAVDDDTLTSDPLGTIQGTNPLTPPFWDVADELTVTDRTTTTVSLSWPAADDADGTIVNYRIEVNGVPRETIGGAILTYQVTGLTPGTTYTFSVHAIDNHDLEAFLSESGTTLIAPAWPGGAELGFSDVTETSLTLSWSAAVDPDGGLAGYRIYQGATEIGSVGPAVATFPVADLTPGTPYSFSVIAFDEDGLESPALPGSTATHIAPTWPPEAALVASNHGQTFLTLTWPAALDQDDGVDYYEIYQGDDPEPIATVDHPTTAFIVSGLTANTTYEFTVVAFDIHGLTTDELSTTATTNDLDSPTWQPGEVLFIGNITPTSVDLSWPAATDDDGTVENYRIEQDDVAIATIGSDVLAHQVTGLTAGTTYNFRVVAIDNDLREGSLSASATTLIAPVWPGGAALTAGSIAETSLTLSWSAATDPDGGLAGYLVYQGDTLLEDLGPTVTTLPVADLDPGTSYTFSVVAYDIHDLETPALETTVSTRIAPTWPGGAALTGSNIRQRVLTLNWPAATDQDGTIVNYRVYKDGALLSTHNASTQTVVVTGLTANQSYDFAVEAVDNHGLATSQLEVTLTTANWVSDTVGAFDPATGRWHLRNQAGNVTVFFYGDPGDIPMMGDWNCDGIDTPGLYRQSTGFAYITNSNQQGVAERSFFFGLPGDIPLAGDFDGDGCDTIGVYRPSEGRVFISNILPPDGGALSAQTSYFFGLPGDKPFVGDFNGDGVDTIGLHRESNGLVYFRNSHNQGPADSEFFFGIANDRLAAGDWGIVNGVDTPVVFRPGIRTWYFRFTNSQGFAEHEFVWGESHWIPISGNFGLGD